MNEWPDEDLLFLDTEGCMLDRFNLPDGKWFPTKFERRTMCLV